MSDIVIKVENLSKQYRLGTVGTGALSHDINRAWYRIRGKEDPYLRIGESNDRTLKGSNEYVWALKDINFEAEHGDVLGIIGRNGAGKSTLLKILSRTTMPTSGSIKLKGRVASLLEVGTGFHPELSGRENIFLNGAILGMTRQEIKRKFDEIVDFAGVERYLDTPVKRYSSGMYVRLAFGVAAHLESEILIVDEVLAVGDAEFQKKCLGKMKGISKGEGRTVLYVSHNMSAIRNLCTHCIVLDKGISVFSRGKTEDALNYYHNSIVKLEHNHDLLNMARSGKGNLKFRSITFINKNNIPINRPVCGEPLKIVVKAEGYERINNVSVAVSFFSLGGECKLILWSEFIGKNLSANVGSNSFECVVDKFPLSKGMYSINLYSSSNPDVLDWIIEACSFEVEDGDFYDTGINIQSINQTVLIPHQWH